MERASSENEELNLSTLEKHPVLVQTIAKFLDFKSYHSLTYTSKTVQSNIEITRPPIEIKYNVKNPSRESFQEEIKKFKFLSKFGKCFSSVHINHKVFFDTKFDTQSFLDNTPNVRKIVLHANPVRYSLRFPERVQTLVFGDSYSMPYGCINSLKPLRQLRNISFLSKLYKSSNTAAQLIDFFSTHKLRKLKLKADILADIEFAEPGAAAKILDSIQCEKLTIIGYNFKQIHYDYYDRYPEINGFFKALSRLLDRLKCLKCFSLRFFGYLTIQNVKDMIPTLPSRLQKIKLDGNFLGLVRDSDDMGARQYYLGEFLSKFSDLTYMNLEMNYFSSESITGFAQGLKHNHKLDELCFGNNNIGDAGFINLCAYIPSTVRKLYVHGCEIGDNGIEVLLSPSLFSKNRKVDHCDHLRLLALGLNGNPVTDIGAKFLAQYFSFNTMLQDIGISFIYMSDAGLLQLRDSILGLKEKKLRNIFLFSSFTCCKIITERTIAEFRKTLPDTVLLTTSTSLARQVKTFD